MARMHEGQAEVDAALVRRLLDEQFPGYQGLPVRAVRSLGTVNAIFRVGADLAARLPLRESFALDLDRELRVLPLLAGRLPLRIPEPVATGQPAGAYPFRWAIYRWIDGQPYADELAGDERAAARDLAGFVTALRAIPVTGDVPKAGRRPLAELDRTTRESIDEMPASFGFGRTTLTAAWERALTAPIWAGEPRWIHTDLLRPNILVAGGRIAAVIDFGMAGAGDPAADVIAAWTVFGPAGREVYRAALGVDDGVWERARGYALHQAIQIIPYYVRTNPGFAASAARTIAEILGDADQAW